MTGGAQVQEEQNHLFQPHLTSHGWNSIEGINQNFNGTKGISQNFMAYKEVIKISIALILFPDKKLEMSESNLFVLFL